jgi:hypothetical protein
VQRAAQLLSDLGLVLHESHVVLTVNEVERDGRSHRAAAGDDDPHFSGSFK